MSAAGEPHSGQDPFEDFVPQEIEDLLGETAASVAAAGR